MSELRSALIVVALLFLAGLALWEWRRSRRRHAGARAESATVIESRVEPRLEPRLDSNERQRRADPEFDGISGITVSAHHHLDVPTIHPAESMRVGVATESAVDIPAAARFEMHVEPRVTTRPADDPPEVDVLLEPMRKPEPVRPPDPEVENIAVAPQSPVIQWPPQTADRVLTLRVVGPHAEPLPGRTLRIALESAALLHGPQGIYHRVTAEGAVLVSVANMIRPGTFDPATMDAQEFRGLSLFSVLPGALPPVRMLEELVALARSLSHRLSAVVQDDQGNELDAAALVALRKSLSTTEDPSGDGPAP